MVGDPEGEWPGYNAYIRSLPHILYYIDTLGKQSKQQKDLWDFISKMVAASLDVDENSSVKISLPTDLFVLGQKARLRLHDKL